MEKKDNISNKITMVILFIIYTINWYGTQAQINKENLPTYHILLDRSSMDTVYIGMPKHHKQVQTSRQT